MGKRLVVGIGVFAALVAGRPAQAGDPVVKCEAAKLKAAGKKLSAKLACYGKVKRKAPFIVEPACLTKAETSFAAAIAKAGALCSGTAAAIEAQVDACVTTLVADAPANDRCDASSVKAMGKGASGALGCEGKGLSKPGTATACRAAAAGKTASALAKAGGCASGDTQADIDACVDPIEGAVTGTCDACSCLAAARQLFPRTPCCPAERITLSGTGGMLKIAGYAPFSLSPGLVTILDSGPPDTTCKHAVTVPAGGFDVTSAFCIPALQYTVQVTANGCASGSGHGAGFLWDGWAGSNGGIPVTNVEDRADSSDGVCDAASFPCASADLNMLGNIDSVRYPGGCSNAIASIVDIPVHVHMWQDASGCPGDGVFNPGVDTTANDYDVILTPTTGQATGVFLDQNADGCSLPGGSPGFGLPSTDCAAGPSGPCSVSGAQPVGPCCVVGQPISMAAVGIAFSNSSPLYDFGFMTVLDSTVSTCGSFVGDTCVVSTDPCQF